jgi:hypothetical protein
MRYALASIVIATYVAQPALAKPCTYPMTRLASAQPHMSVAPRAKESRNPPCTILQKGTQAGADLFRVA